jgi:hypothetical protein
MMARIREEKESAGSIPLWPFRRICLLFCPLPLSKLTMIRGNDAQRKENGGKMGLASLLANEMGGPPATTRKMFSTLVSVSFR